MRVADTGTSRLRGSTYEGSYVRGCKHGFGKLTAPYDSDYEGEWRNDMLHGLGTLTNKSGKVYVGYWKENSEHGESI